MCGRSAHRRIECGQQIGLVGGDVGPSVVLPDHLDPRVRGVGRHRIRGAAADDILRVADRDPGDFGGVGGARRVGGPVPQRRVDHLSALAVANQGDRRGITGAAVHGSLKPGRALVVERLPEGDRRVVDGIAGVGRGTQVTTKLARGEEEERLDPDQTALERQDSGRQSHLRIGLPHRGPRRRQTRSDSGGDHAHRQSDAQQCSHSSP